MKIRRQLLTAVCALALLLGSAPSQEASAAPDPIETPSVLLLSDIFGKTIEGWTFDPRDASGSFSSALSQAISDHDASYDTWVVKGAAALYDANGTNIVAAVDPTDGTLLIYTNVAIDGVVQVGNDTAVNCEAKTQGVLRFDDNVDAQSLEICRTADGTTYAWEAVGKGNAGGKSYWIKSGNDISSDVTGNVGIGTSSPDPTAKLDVNGNAHISGDLKQDGRAYIGARNVGTAGRPDTGTALAVDWNYDAGHRAISFWNTNAGADVNNGYNKKAFSFKQLTGNGTAHRDIMTMKMNGNVGIGTTSPDAKLTVNGDIGLTNGASISNLNKRTDIGFGAARLEFYDEGHTRTGRVGLVYGDSSGEGEVVFAHYDGSTWDTKMLLDKDGNVGIGTTSPGAKLDVNGSIRGHALVASTNDATLYIHDTEDDPAKPNTQTSIGQRGSKLHFWNAETGGNWDHAMTLDILNGRLGIGTTDPESALNVKGTLTIGEKPGTSTATANVGNSIELITDDTFGGVNDNHTGIRMFSYDMNGWQSAKLGIQVSDGWGTYYGGNAPAKTDMAMVIGLNETIIRGKVGIGTTSPGIDLAIGDSDTGLQQQGDGKLAIYTNNAERMRVDHLGNVGIGTSSPDAKLHVTTTNSTSIEWAQILKNNHNTSTTGYGVGLKLSQGANSEDNKWAGIASIAETNWASGTGLAFYSDESEKMRIDRDGNVGIGTTAPTAKFDVAGNIKTTSNIISGAGSGGVAMTINDGYGNANLTFNHTRGVPEQNGNAGRIRVNTDSTSDAFMGFELKDNVTKDVAVNTSRIMTLLSNGNVGIGTASPGYKLDVNGDIRAGAFFYMSSDERLKKNILTLDSALEKVLQLRGVSFDWKADGRQDIGFVAQEIEKIFPDLVNTDADGMKSVRYANITAILVEAIKEQQAEIDAQQVEIESLRSDVEELKAAVAALQN